MTWISLAAWLLPAVVGLLLWLLPRGSARLRPLALTAAILQLAIATALLTEAAKGNLELHSFGDWQPPFGISFTADRLSALLVLLQSVLLLVTVWVLRGETHGRRTAERAVPLLFLLSSGLSAAFQTGDLFNLFVCFEVVLLASYTLLQVPGSGRSRRAAFANVAINLVASLFFFLGVAVLYGRFGTVNLADLAVRMGEAPAGVEVFAISLLVVAFAVKAGVVPLVFWLPATYPSLAGPVAAFFAGMMTKLGVFALLRTVPLLQGAAPLPEILVWAGAASAVLGSMAALSEYEVRRLLGFHIVSQVGYMVLGLGLLTVGAVAGAVFYLTHHILVKAALFFVADELERRNGSRDLRHMAAERGGPAGIFLLSALSLAGLPPLSGFFAKVGLFRATLEIQAWGALAALAVASFFTLASMLKVWRYAFWRREPRARPLTAGGGRFPWPLALLVALSLVLALAAGPVFRFAEATAEQVLQGAPVGQVAAGSSGTPDAAGGTP